MKRFSITNMKDAENFSIMVHANSNMEDLLDRAINQNYVPVVDDQGYFIGIITRKEIIKYCYKELKKAYSKKNEEPEQ